MVDSKDNITEDLSADKVDADGMWTLSSGHVVDLRHVHLHLPDGRGHEQVHAVVFGTSGFVDECSNCGSDLDGSGSLMLIMDEHYYLIAKCCDTMILYKKNEVMTKWT